MKLFKWLLFPFSILYDWITRVRNHQFDTGQRPVTDFDPVVISVGNLSMGGTGKTPMIENLIRVLKDEHKVATVSRGYGRKTRGFRLANEEDTAESIGDEPLQFYKKFGRKILVSVGEERILAIPSVLLDHPETEVFLLDDAYQHRKAGRDLNILLTDYSKPFFDDFVVPYGGLREARKGAARADCIIMTKCPDLSNKQKAELSNRLRKYATGIPIYFSRIKYMEPKAVFGASVNTIGKDIVLITGLANSQSLVSFLGEAHNIIEHFKFQDHHHFNSTELDRINEKLSNTEGDVSIMTTEKDMVRLLKFKDHMLFKKNAVFYTPIGFVIDENEEFQKQLFDTIKGR